MNIQKDFITLLKEFVSFESISTDPEYKTEIDKTVKWLATLFMNNSFEVQLWQGPHSNPVVYAKKVIPNTKETVLVYGHYDVQPAQKEDGWKNNPFNITEDNERLYGRGVIDNKGQVLIHIYTVLKLLKENRLNYNVIFLIEGNEETSNEDLANLLKENKKALKADHIIISDGETPVNQPTLESSLRGGFNLKLTYKTAETNLHSGIWGGAVPNAAVELSKFVASLYNKDGSITIPKFYNNVDKVSKAQIENNKKLYKSTEALLKSIGAKKALFDKENEFYKRTCQEPTIQVTGFKSGYINNGYSNIVPNIAEVRLNVRTTSSQKTEDVLKLLKNYIKSNTPDYVEYETENSAPYEPVKLNTNTPIAKKTKKLLKESFGKEPIEKPVGGGIPIVSDFKEILGIDALLVPLANEDCNMHGVNENFRKEHIQKALEFSERFFGI